MLAAPSSSMSPSSPAGTPDTSLELHDDASTKRRVSSRVRSKPTIYSDKTEPSPASNGVKRKRAPIVGDNISEDVSEGGGSPAEESDPDEEELKEKRRKARSGTKKPAAKKSKTTTLAMRPATNGVKRTTKPKKARGQAPVIAGHEEIGLFGS